MPVSIRSRLLALVMSWVLPAIAAALWIVYAAAAAERDAHERTLQDSVRALSQVVDRELSQRRTIATVMAGSRALDHLPALAPSDAEQFLAQARQAMAGLDGWIELSVPGRVLLDTRRPDGTAADAVPRSTALVDTPDILPLSRGDAAAAQAAVVAPVRRGGRTIANLAVTIVPAELQRILDAQKMPRDWVGTVIDGARVVVARHPGGVRHAGREATADLREKLDRSPEGRFTSVSLDGVAVVGYYRTTPLGWTFVAAMPQDEGGGFLDRSAVQVGLGAAAFTSPDMNTFS